MVDSKICRPEDFDFSISQPILPDCETYCLLAYVHPIVGRSKKLDFDL